MHHTWRVFLLLVYIQILPAVLRVNIPKNPASLRVSLVFPHWLGDSPRCSRTSHSRSHGAPVPVIRDPSYSDGRPECPPRVWFSPVIDPSKFTLHLLSDTPRGSQWREYILLMNCQTTAFSRRDCPVVFDCLYPITSRTRGKLASTSTPWGMMETILRATVEILAYVECVSSCCRHQSVTSSNQNVILISIGSEW